jgi:hypothetical protein
MCLKKQEYLEVRRVVIRGFELDAHKPVNHPKLPPFVTTNRYVPQADNEREKLDELLRKRMTVRRPHEVRQRLEYEKCVICIQIRLVACAVDCIRF